MKAKVNDFSLRLARLNPNHMRLLLVILTLVLFVLGAGAPGTGGGPGIKSITFFGF